MNEPQARKGLRGLADRLGEAAALAPDTRLQIADLLRLGRQHAKAAEHYRTALTEIEERLASTELADEERETLSELRQRAALALAELSEPGAEGTEEVSKLADLLEVDRRLELADAKKRRRRYAQGFELYTSALESLDAALQRLDPADDDYLEHSRQRDGALRSLGVCALHAEGLVEGAAALALAKRLRRIRQTNLARRLILRRLWSELVARPEAEQAEIDSLYLRTRGELALCTALATDLAAGARLDEAAAILRRGPRSAEDADADHLTLHRAAFVAKSRWQRGLERSDLQAALGLYERALQTADRVLDELSSLAEVTYLTDSLAALDERASPAEAQRGRKKSDGLRRAFLRRQFKAASREIAGLGEDPRAFRPLVNLAQLFFGLGRWTVGGDLLDRARRLGGTAAWRREVAAREIVQRAQLSHDLQPQDKDSWERAREALGRFVGGRGRTRDRALDSAFTGKVGLALSGGGLRAALYHLGMLAALAERDLLPRIEVLSCVSGGSIAGAHYYLRLRERLQACDDGEIDYVALVQRVIADFDDLCRRNLRARVLSNPLALAKMLWPFRAYTTADRIGELLEKFLYGKVEGKAGGDPWRLTDLTVQPKGESHFHPAFENWKRHDKVPMLVLNATSLNTGHNWQFTSTFMGEPPAAIDAEIDASYRLRRMYLADEAPPPHGETTLGLAVATSAAVPGLFDPMTLARLYEKEDRPVVVRLVDGGVFDNQGISGLLEQDCSVVLVSDASGMMRAQDYPSASMVRVPLRSNAILQERVRQAQYQDLVGRRRSSLLTGLLFVHLKKGLAGESVDWIDCYDPTGGSDLAASRPVYDIDLGLQRLLCELRTDLDSFCEIEAYALMACGYEMTRRDLEGLAEAVPGLVGRDPRKTRKGAPDWPFLQVAPLLAGDGEGKAAKRFRRVLEVSRSQLFRLFHYGMKKPAVRGLVYALLAAVFSALLGGLWLVRRDGDRIVAWIDRLQGPEAGAATLAEFTPLESLLILLLWVLPPLVLAGAAAAILSLLFRRFGARTAKFLERALVGGFSFFVGGLDGLTSPLYRWVGSVRRLMRP